MSERGEKRKVEFIESYWTGGEYGSDYIWSDNHGELIRCKDCTYRGEINCPQYYRRTELSDSYFCADGKRE
jgi:hypothetical protein